MSVTKQRQMKLATFIHNAGSHPGGWRYTKAEPVDQHDFETYNFLAKTAERGKLHCYFSGDAQGFHHIEGRDAFSASDNGGKLEPTTLLSALALTTSDIGLLATASTTYNEPYNLARRFASLDHLTKGRAGWNVVTSASDNEAHNFGLVKNVAHDDRYDRAEEFVDVVKRLWDSWEDHALLRDQAAGRYFDPDKVHALFHEGKHFQVRGPLNIARPPQGHPIIVQAGGSGPGRNLAARTADMIFTAQSSYERAKDFYADIKGRVQGFGRDPASAIVLPSVQLQVCDSEADCKRVEEEMLDLIPPALALGRLQNLLGDIDLSGYPVDGPLPELGLTNAGQWVQQEILRMARDEGLSIGQIAKRVSVSRASFSMFGTPEMIADTMEHWFLNEAADGFSLTPNYLPGNLVDFVDHVVPILQKRGLFHTDYEGGTLRENLGLERPANWFTEAPGRGREPDIWGKNR